jgi:signal transduction histidine kinase
MLPAGGGQGAGASAATPATAWLDAPEPSVEREELDRLVRAEQLRTLNQQIGPVTMANVLVSSLLVVLYYGAVPTLVLGIWWLAMTVSSLVRLWQRQRYWREGPEADSERWARWLVIGSAVSGVLWGTAGAIFFTDVLDFQVLISFVLGGMAAGATTAMPAHFPAFLVYLIPSFAPLIFSFFSAGDLRHLVMGCMSVVFSGCVLAIGRNISRSLHDAYRLRFENQSLAAQIQLAQEELKEANVHLENRVAERTAELQQSQRSQAQLETELHQARRLEAIGQLTGGVAHDFNNLLTVVIGSLELIDDRTRGDTELREVADQAITAARRGAELTRNLLAFSRKQSLQPRPIDPNELVARTVAGLLERTLGENVQLETCLEAGLWNIVVDPAQLETALLNLAINARDAMPDGGALTIETRSVPAGRMKRAVGGEPLVGDYVCISVRDTGCGVPANIRDRVFEPFFTTKTSGEGSGLGLSMVYGFVKQSDGHVELLSEEGQGTEVQLYFPRSERPAEPAPGEPEPLRASRGEVILVVEDAAGVREMAVRLLRSLGYRTLEVDGPEGALDLLDRGVRVDLLLSDVVMPGPIDGIKLARAARDRRPELRIVLVSGYSEVMTHNQDAPHDWKLLPKPYDRRSLARAVRNALDGPRG